MILRSRSMIQQSAGCRRLTAIHEAGHFTIGRHVGLLTFDARIMKNLPRQPDEKFWIGDTTWSPQGATRTKIRMFAVAGAVAECCWMGETFEDTLDGWDEPAAMSQTDWDFSGCAPGEPSRQLMRTIEKVFALLDRTDGKLWRDVLLTARRLIKESRE